MLMYRLMQGFLRVVVAIFFRNIEVIGKENIPQDGSIIFAGNHPNSLIDPLMVITQSGKVVHFAARDGLFKSRFLRFFLDSLGAVPIKKRQDHKPTDGKVDNQAAFDALFSVLSKGGCMGIFPEGISHTDSEMSTFKTGTARIAFGVHEKHPETKLWIVPVGLTYMHRQRVRSQCLIQFDEPIAIDEAWMERYKEAPKETVRALTSLLDLRLRGVTLNAPDWETMRILHTARRLYKPDRAHLSLEEYAELTRRFAEGYLRVSDKPEVQALREHLADYQSHLDSLQIRDHDLRKDAPPLRVFGKILRRLSYLLIMLPLAIPGALLHMPIIFSAIVAGDRLTRRKDVVATTKLIVSVLTIPMLYAALLLGLTWYISPWVALFTAPFLPLTGFATMRVLEEKLQIGKSLTALSRLVRFEQEVEELRQKRKELVQEIDRAVDHHHDPSIPRMFEKSATSAS